MLAWEIKNCAGLKCKCGGGYGVGFLKGDRIPMKNKLFSAAALTLAMSMCLGTLAYAGESKYFTDVNSDSYGWASDAVDYLWANNVAKGTGGNNYSPELPIERGDFVVLLNNSFDLGEFSGYMYGFSDVPNDSYYHDAIVNAKGSGVIKDNFSFYPELPIMRGDAMCMLYRALDLNGYIKNATTDLSMYSDAYTIKDVNAQMAVATLTSMGIISGNGGRILYTDHMSRAEMAMVFYKTLTYVEANPTTKPKTTQESEKTTVVANKPQADETETSYDPTVYTSETAVKKTIVIDGKEFSGIENTDVKVQNSAKNGVEITGKTNGTISNCAISAKSVNSKGVFVDAKSSADITDTKIYSSGSGAVALKGAANSVIKASGCDINTEGRSSYVVKTSGEADFEDSSIYIREAKGLVSEESGELNIKNCNITADDLTDGIFVGSRGSNDDNSGQSVINVRNSSIVGDRKTTLFYSDKNDIKALLKGTTVEKIGYLVNSRASAEATENTIEITLDAQEVEADVIAEEYTRVIINLKNGSLLKGSINESNTAKYVEVNVEGGSQLELTSNSYIDVFKYNDVIDIYENGYTIFYDKENEKNDWLFADDYQLANGGKLSPE